MPPDQEAAGTRYLCFAVITAQAMCAIVLARATATSILASQESVVDPRRSAWRTTAVAPVISSRLNLLWPLFEILPSLGLPPVVCWRGTRPFQGSGRRDAIHSTDANSPSMTGPDSAETGSSGIW